MTIAPELGLDATTGTTFLLVLARTTAWVVSAPVLAMRGLPAMVKITFALALALFLTPLYDDAALPSDLPRFVLAVATQVGVGLALGFLTNLLLVAVEAAGALADLTSGFSYGSLVDPVSGASSAAFARLANLSFVAVLFASDGHRTIVAGFARSFEALPLDRVPSLSADGAAMLGTALTETFVAALQIGAPLLGALFLTEVALALMSRFVPQANVIAVGLPAKALVAFATAGTLLATLPAHLGLLLEPALRLPGLVLQ